MNCTNCGEKLKPLEEIEIMEAEAELTVYFGRLFKAPDKMKRCEACFKLDTGEVSKH